MSTFTVVEALVLVTWWGAGRLVGKLGGSRARGASARSSSSR